MNIELGFDGACTWLEGGVVTIEAYIYFDPECTLYLYSLEHCANKQLSHDTTVTTQHLTFANKDVIPINKLLEMYIFANMDGIPINEQCLNM